MSDFADALENCHREAVTTVVNHTTLGNGEATELVDALVPVLTGPYVVRLGEYRELTDRLRMAANQRDSESSPHPEWIEVQLRIRPTGGAIWIGPYPPEQIEFDDVASGEGGPYPLGHHDTRPVPEGDK